jgi:hypothetical protein
MNKYFENKLKKKRNENKNLFNIVVNFGIRMEKGINMLS